MFKNKIKILVVFSNLDVGGAEIQFASLLSRLNKESFDIHVAYYNAVTGFPKKILEESGVSVHFIGSQTWNRLRCIIDCIKLINCEKFDVVHCISHSTNFYGCVPAILNRVPVIINGLQGMVELERFWPIIYSLVNTQSSGWIVNSDALKEYAQRKICFLSSNELHVVPNGVDLNAVSCVSESSLKFYQQLKGGRQIVGTVGRLHQIKNQLLFIRMARELISLGVDADFWIIGKGPEFSRLEQFIIELNLGDRVHLLGFRDDIPAALSFMNLFVLTSDSESCPNALLEAMCASLPVISTRSTRLDHIIHSGKNGFIVDTGDLESLVKYAFKILTDPREVLSMGTYSRCIIEENFSITSAVNKLQDLYLTIVQRKADVRLNWRKTD